MAIVLEEISRTFGEYLLLPNLTRKSCTPDNVSLQTPLSRFRPPKKPKLQLNVPFTSAIMQSVSDSNLAVALARSGGLSFIYCSQDPSEQASMVSKVKRFKAGFVISDANLSPEATLSDVISLSNKTGHGTIPITENGLPDGQLLGILTGRDYRLGHSSLDEPVKNLMTPFSSLFYGKDGISLTEANNLIWKHRLNCLPIIGIEKELKYLVFRKDYDEHKENPNELIDSEKRLMVGAGINTFDYQSRIPQLIEAGVDILCVDSSDGFNEWQFECIKWIKKNYGDDIYIGAGNIIDGEGFTYLAKAGADFIKVGVGPGSICITREQKGIGRGQASAVIDVAKTRNKFFSETGEYIPICADRGIFHDYQIPIALALGADFTMMGRYFARFDESPAPRIRMGSNFVKEYWGEGTSRAKNWQRYKNPSSNSSEIISFEEGVDGYVPYAGMLRENMEQTIEKIKATFCNCGVATIAELQQQARLTVVSSISLRENGSHDVLLKETSVSPER